MQAGRSLGFGTAICQRKIYRYRQRCGKLAGTEAFGETNLKEANEVFYTHSYRVSVCRAGHTQSGWQ